MGKKAGKHNNNTMFSEAGISVYFKYSMVSLWQSVYVIVLNADMVP